MLCENPIQRSARAHLTVPLTRQALVLQLLVYFLSREEPKQTSPAKQTARVRARVLGELAQAQQLSHSSTSKDENPQWPQAPALF